jgi:hypothetical protein
MARGLPAKYAKMGFKKGWGAYKATQRGRKKTKAITRTRKRNVRKTAKRKNGISFTSGMKAQGLLLDAGWGLVGLSLLGRNNPGALPVTRIIQGLAANTVFPNMGGKRRLVYGLLDYLDLWLARTYPISIGDSSSNGASLYNILAPVRNLAKVRPL